jgi:hypothetical protein
MSALTNAAEQALLELLFMNQAWANIGDASGLQPSAADGNFYVSLHTASPTDAGNQQSSEVAYTSYARVAVSRATGWEITGTGTTVVSNVAEVIFPQCTGSSATATHFGIGTASSGAGNLLLHGALDDPLAISLGITPQFAAGALDVEAQ